MEGSSRKTKYIYALSIYLFSTLIANVTPANAEADLAIQRIVEIVDGLKAQLGIHEPVEVKLVPNNNLAFSVEPADHHAHYLLSIDTAFLVRLDDQDLTAAIAHELGHVWIYTHHPFLQTEALANEIAMRVVSRDSLKSLYQKLWTFDGEPGDYEKLLGHVQTTAK
jgi:hypothetical protein